MLPLVLPVPVEQETASLVTVNKRGERKLSKVNSSPKSDHHKVNLPEVSDEVEDGDEAECPLKNL